MAATITGSYLVIIILIGIYASTRSKNVQEYLVAKRNLGAVMVMALLFGEMLSGAATVGNATESFKVGLSAVWINWGMVLGLWLFALLRMGKFFRAFGNQRGGMSVPEAYKFLFDRRTSMAMMLILVIVYAIIYALQPLALAGILGPMFGIDKTLMAIIAGGIMTLVAVTGGLTGMAWMNCVHATVMILALFAVTWASVGHVGGLAVMKASLPPTYFDFIQPDWLTVIAWAFGTGISMLCAATTAGAAFGAKSDSSVNKGMFFAGLLILGYPLMPALIGMAAKVSQPEMAPAIALFGMANSISPLMGGLASMAVVAAILSTGPALLLIVGTVLARDFYKGLLKPEATDREQLIFSRVMVGLVGILGTYFGLQATSILHSVLGAFQIRAFAGVVLAVALFWPRVTKEAAFWSLCVGGALAGIWHFAGNPYSVQPLWPSLGVGLTILCGMTLLSKEPVSPGFRRYREVLREDDARGIEMARKQFSAERINRLTSAGEKNTAAF